MVSSLSLDMTLDDAASSSWDAIVIGAGTSGSTAAAQLVRNGFRTLLVDGAVFPRPKVCGGCLAPAGVRGLRESGLGAALERTEPLKVDRLDVSVGGCSATLPIPAYHVIDRRHLDHNLVHEVVRSGAAYMGGTRAVIQEDDAVVLAVDGEERVVRPKVLVVADGLQGTALSRRDDFAWIVKRRGYVGMGATVDRIDLPCRPGRVTMYSSASGYLGAAPISSGGWILAAAVSPELIRRIGKADAIAGILESNGVDSSLLGRIKWRGVSQLTRHRRKAAGGRILVIGDAMHYLEPFTGEGMSWGIHCAQHLVPFARSVADGGSVGTRWRKSCIRRLSRRRLTCRLVGAATRHPAVLKTALRAGRNRHVGAWLARRLCWRDS